MDRASLIAEARALGIDVAAFGVLTPEEKKEDETKKTLALLQEAESLGIDPSLINAVKGSTLGGERARLEQQQVAADADRTQAAYNLRAAEDSTLTNVGQIVSDTNALVGQGMVGLADIATSPLRLAFNAAGQGSGMLEEGQRWDSVADLMPDSMRATLQEDGLQSQEEVVRFAARGMADALMLGASFAPVARAAGSAEGVVADMVGLGMSTEIGAATGSRMAAAELHARTKQAMDNVVDVDNMVELDLGNKVNVNYWANKINDDMAVTRNIQKLDDAETYNAKQIEWQEARDVLVKKRDALSKNEVDMKERAGLNSKIKELDDVFQETYVPVVADAPTKFSLETVKAMAERFNQSPIEITKAIARAGGIDASADVYGVAQRHSNGLKDLSDAAARSAKTPNMVTKFGNNVIRPVSRIVANYVGKRAGSQFEKAFESAARNSEKMYSPYAANTAGSTAVREWMDTPEVKRGFINLRYTGNKGMDELKQMASDTLSPEGKKIFGQLLADTAAYNKRASRVYTKDTRKDEVYWASSFNKAEDEAATSTMGFDKTSEPTSISGAVQRKRGFLKEDDPLIDSYDNPFIAQLERIRADENLIQLSEKFNLRPSVGVDGTTVDFFNAAQTQFGKAMPEQQAAYLRELMEATTAGSRKQPNLPIRLFMKQSYAGTLGQFDSALLNLHDLSVSAWHNGAMPTGKAVVQRLMGSGEFNLRELGMTNDASSLEEFRIGFDGAITGQKGIEKVADDYSNVAFKWSGFQSVDRFGKSVTLAAAKNAMEASAKKGTLAKDFGYMLDSKDLGTLSAALKKGTRLDDMTPKQQAVMEEAMFARLGEQQLISMAGRPLGYLKHPNLRPLWAMSGFAIKQADMLYEKASQEVAAGNYGAAGKVFAGYIAWVAAGFGITDSMRKIPSHLITGDERTAPTAENFALRSADQLAAVISFNKLGDEFSRGEFMQDPVGSAFGMIEPPGGALGNFFKDVGRVMTGKETKAHSLKSLPLVGDTLYDIWNR